jgi:antitoxin MazE
MSIHRKLNMTESQIPARTEARTEATTEAILDIKAWGNNLGVRLPASVARAARLTVNQRVRITVEDGRVIIALHGDKVMSLQDRLAVFDPVLHGDEAMVTAPVGREVW